MFKLKLQFTQEKYIEECLDSVLTQKTKYKFETIVINDGSTDHSGELLEKYKDQVVLRTQENRGFSGARNRGLSDLRGRYLMFVDSDDVLLPDAIEALMNTAYESNADIVEGSSDALRSVRGGWQREPNFRREDNCTDCGIGVLSGVPWAKVWRSSIWQNYKLPEGFWFEDTFPYMVIYPKKYKI